MPIRAVPAQPRCHIHFGRRRQRRQLAAARRPPACSLPFANPWAGMNCSEASKVVVSLPLTRSLLPLLPARALPLLPSAAAALVLESDASAFEPGSIPAWVRMTLPQRDTAQEDYENNLADVERMNATGEVRTRVPGADRQPEPPAPGATCTYPQPFSLVFVHNGRCTTWCSGETASRP